MSDLFDGVVGESRDTKIFLDVADVGSQSSERLHHDSVVPAIVSFISHRPDLFTTLVTAISIATPTYGATLHKTYLRIAGFVIGGSVSLLAIIVVSPNFDSLPAYMLRAFAVFYPFAYESLLSIHTPEVLELIQGQDPTWEAMVPDVVGEAIKTKNLFGLKSNS